MNFRTACKAILTVSALASSAAAMAHDGHGLFGSHWHATDVLGFIAVAAVAYAIWASRK